MVFNTVSKRHKDNNENLRFVVEPLLTKSSSSRNSTSRSESLLSSYYKSKPLLRDTTTSNKPLQTRFKINNYNTHVRNSRLLETQASDSTKAMTISKNNNANNNKKAKGHLKNKKNTTTTEYKKDSITTISPSIPSKRKGFHDATNFTALSLYTTIRMKTTEQLSTKGQKMKETRLVYNVCNEEIIREEIPIIEKNQMINNALQNMKKDYPVVNNDHQERDINHQTTNIDHQVTNIDRQVTNNSHQVIQNDYKLMNNEQGITTNHQEWDNDDVNTIYDELSRNKINQQKLLDIAEMKYDQPETSIITTRLNYILKPKSHIIKNVKPISRLHTNVDSNTMIPTSNMNLNAKNEVSCIHSLNDDCLYEIFKYLSTPTYYCILASVCQRWNNILYDPYLWRQMDYKWVQFIYEHHSISNYFQQYKKLPLQLQHIRKLHIENDYQLEKKIEHIPSIPLFHNLRELHLSYIYLDDIMDLILTTVNIEILRCKHIMTRPPVEHIMLTPFTKLKKLKVLELAFDKICEHINSASLASGRRPQHSRYHLSPTLKVLNFTNICDLEQSLFIRNQVREDKKNELIASLLLSSTLPSSSSSSSTEIHRLIQNWNSLEDTLLQKYKLLSALTHLNELSLGFCHGFTARIWRECIQPCTYNLKKMTLYGWDNNEGYLENPKNWLERKWFANMLGSDQIENDIQDVEKALAETIEGLSSIEYLSFNQFQCGYGLTAGLQSLLKSKSLSICQIIVNHPKNNNSNSSSLDFSIEHLDRLLNISVNKIDIIVTDKKDRIK